MRRTSRRQKVMTLKELETRKVKLERRMQALTVEYTDVCNGIKFVIADLAKVNGLSEV